MKVHTVIVWAALGLPLALGRTSGADETTLLENRLGEDPAGIEPIALYPEEVRDAILEAATQPALIVRLSMLQSASSAAFEDLLADYPRHTQEAVWDLARFPGLVARLAQGDPKSRRQVEEIAADFPPEIRRAIVEYGGRERGLLVEAHALKEESDAGLRELLDGHPRAVQESFRRLLHHPEVLAILSEDMSLTILLGEAYKADPRQVRERAAELHLELAQEHAEALVRSAPRGEPPPAYTGEYADVAQAYARQYAYEDRGFERPGETGDSEVNVTYYTYPYPYWFGYPRWYAPPVWGASLGWYITPNVRASMSFYPHVYYRLAAPRYHATVWSRQRLAPRRVVPRRVVPRRVVPRGRLRR